MNKNKTQNLHLYEPVKALKGHKGPIYVAKFNKDGQYVMTGSQDRSILLWNPYKQLLLKSYTGAHNYEVTDIAISNDNARFASCGGDKTPYYWDISTGQQIRKIGAHNTRINCVALYDQSLLATGGYDCEIRLWDIKEKKTSHPVQKIKEFQDSVTQIIFDNYQMIASSVDGHIKYFDIRNGLITEDYFGAGILSFGVSYDNNLLCLSCVDSKVRIVERKSGSVLQAVGGSHISKQYRVQSQFSWNDGQIMTGSEDGWMYIYDILTGKMEISRKLHDKCLSSLELSSQKNAFITASYDNIALLWMEQN